jgi:Ca2+-transporting ATPase
LPPRSAWRVAASQFRGLIVVLLAAAALVSLAFGEPIEATAIAAVIVLNAAIGFATELGAVRFMEALRNLGAVTEIVRRDGHAQTIAAFEVAPGDVILLDGGDLISADARILEASKLETNESTLTGESLPVAKTCVPIAAGAPLAERSCMVWNGTTVTRGTAVAVVTATGMATELGHISALVEGARTETTPLEQRLAALGGKLVRLTLVVVAEVTAGGLLAGTHVVLAIQTGIALAVAAVPEGLPVVATIALARSMLRMARKHALVRRLAAVETLGSTSIIFAGKSWRNSAVAASRS